MSIVDSPARKDYVGDGTTSVFAFDFDIAADADVEVLLNGATLLLNSDYTVQGAGQLNGGSVTILPAPVAAAAVLLLRRETLEQTSRYQQNEDLPSARVEGDFDHGMRVVQQLRETLGRALRFAKSSLLSNPLLPDGVVGKLLQWKSATELTNVDVSVFVPGAVTLPLAVANGGTGSATAATARAALGAGGLADEDTWTARQHWAKGANIASAASLAPGTDGNTFHVTGTTTITSIVVKPAGSILVLIFDGILTVTHNASTLILRDAVNMTTAVNDVLILASEGSGNWREIARRQAQTALTPGGHLWGLGVSNSAGDPTNDLDVAVGEAVSDDVLIVNRVLLNAGAMTKRIDAVWAAGTNQGGLDTADNLSGAKTFHLYLFRRTGGVDDFFISTSLTPTLPDSGTKKRRIFSFLWSGTAIRPFTQFGDEVWLTTPLLDVDVANPGTAAVTRTLTVPTGIVVKAYIRLLGFAGSTNFVTYASSLVQTDSQASTTVAPLTTGLTGAGASVLGATPIELWTNTSGQIRTRQQASGASDLLKIVTDGWLDRRGRG